MTTQILTSDYHIPVMLNESLEGLNLKRDGKYVDVTYGGGGHSKALLEKLGPSGQLFAFDRDSDAVENQLDDERLTLIHHDYRWIRNFLSYYKAVPIDGILADLGVSSHQLDTGERGFSFRQEADIDLRMDADTQQSAKEILNTYSAEELQRIFGEYGEIRNARTLAQNIVQSRSLKVIELTSDLVAVVEKTLHKRDKWSKYLSQVFQALRIEVNDELGSLKTLLEQCAELLTEGGRLSVITYHSLEDRLVKNFINTGSLDGKAEVDFFGNVNKPFKAVHRKPLLPTDEEIAGNPRSRSAKLRVAERA